jgi:hypothetical protein
MSGFPFLGRPCRGRLSLSGFAGDDFFRRDLARRELSEAFFPGAILSFLNPSRVASAVAGAGLVTVIGFTGIATALPLTSLTLVVVLEDSLAAAVLTTGAGVRALLRAVELTGTDFGAVDFLPAEGLLTDVLATEPLAPFRPVPRLLSRSCWRSRCLNLQCKPGLKLPRRRESS